MKNFFNILFWIILFSGLLTLMGFIAGEKQKLFCNRIIVEIDHRNGQFFIEEKDILRIISRSGISLTGKPISDIDFNMIEELVRKNPWTKEVEVYSTLDGMLIIDIKQRRPILRILAENVNKNFYIDEDGNIIPVSNTHTARVLVATGNISTRQISELYKFATYVNKNSFWRSQLSHIYLHLDGDMVLIPRVGRHRIIFGNTSDMENKFERMMVFYKKGLNVVGWNVYRTVNLKFKDQIVCTK